MSFDSRAHDIAAKLAQDFLTRVWGPKPDLDAIDELMTEDYRITSAGKRVEGRAEFKAWVAEFQRRMPGAQNEILDIIASPDGSRVASRWICSGTNNGMFGCPADGRPFSFSGLSLWRVRDGRLCECWVERSGLEAYLELSGKT